MERCTENYLRGRTVRVRVAPGPNNKAWGTWESAALDPISVVEMIHNDVFLAAAQIPELRPSTSLDYGDHAHASDSFM